MAGPPARHGLGTVEQFILGFLGACTVFVAALDPVAAAGVLGSFYVLWRVVG